MNSFLIKIFSFPGMDDDVLNDIKERPFRDELQANDIGPVDFASSIHALFDTQHKHFSFEPNEQRIHVLRSKNIIHG